MALTADEQREMDHLELEQLEAEKSASSSVAPAQAVPPEIPRTAYNTDQVIPTPFGAITLNPEQTVHTVKNLGLEGGGATLGQIAGAPFAEFGGVQAGGAIGGALGNIAGQLTTPGKKFSLGEVGGAAVGGAIPGASLAKATARTVAMQGAKYAAGNVAAVNTQSMIDTGKPASLKQDAIAAIGGAAGAPLSKFLDKGLRAEATRIAAAQDSVRRETLNAGRELGLVVPPAVTSPNAANNTLNSLAGKAATAQEAIIRNQPKINDAVRAEIGMASDVPLSPIALNTQRVGPNMVYDQIAKHSPEADGLLGQFKGAMDQARELRAAYRASIDAGTPNNATLLAARAAEAQADVFKQGLKKVLPTPLYDSFDAARTQLAKIGLAERAIRLGDGNVDAKVFGDALESGEKLTGNFSKLGRFQSAFGRYVKEAATTPPSGVDNLKMMAKLGLGGAGGYAAGGPFGAVAGAAAMTGAEKGARELALSPFYQRNFAQPFYGATNEDFQAALARYSAMNASRQN